MGESDGPIRNATLTGDPGDRNAAFAQRKCERTADWSASSNGNVHLG